MGFFKDANHVCQVLGGFFKKLGEDENIGGKLLGSKLKLQFNYKDPDASLGIDLTGDAVKILENPQDFKPDVQMNMKADVAHKFWQGQVNLVTALARREITAKGPISKILKLLPIIKPAYKIYPEYLESLG